MATTLYYVQGDTLPQIKLTLSDQITSSPKDLTSPTVKVHLHVKPATGSGVSFTREALLDSNPTDRTNGIAYIQWLPGDLNRPAGEYNAEVEIFDSASEERETVYEMIKLVIREDIGDIPPAPPGASTPIPPNSNP